MKTGTKPNKLKNEDSQREIKQTIGEMAQRCLTSVKTKLQQ